jgi:hypothetical protein
LKTKNTLRALSVALCSLFAIGAANADTIETININITPVFTNYAPLAPITGSAVFDITTGTVNSFDITDPNMTIYGNYQTNYSSADGDQVLSPYTFSYADGTLEDLVVANAAITTSLTFIGFRDTGTAPGIYSDNSSVWAGNNVQAYDSETDNTTITISSTGNVNGGGDTTNNVPEPVSVALFGVGIASLVGARRRKSA